MRRRTYYTWAILVPLAVFVVVAGAGGEEYSSTVGLGPGATVHWLYPRSAIREMVAYGAVALWLLWTLYRRSLAEYQQAVWRAPMILVAIHFLLPLAVMLANGVARAMAAEQGERIGLRIVVRLLVGYGYVWLAEWVARELPLRDAAAAREAMP